MRGSPGVRLVPLSKPKITHRDRLLSPPPQEADSPTQPAGRDQPDPATYSRTIRAGTPATTHRSGTVPRTTDPAATTTFRPMRAPGKTTAPAPSQVPEPIDTDMFTGHCRPIGTSGSA